jgi:SAM-dependent methyltransferase
MNDSRSELDHGSGFPQKGILKRLAEAIFEFESRLARSWAAASHKRLFASQWCLPPAPEWFDHSIDLFYQWPRTNSSFWLERGVFGCLALKGGRVLELSCGDGFNAKHFYSQKSKEIIACDFDPTAIRAARGKIRCLMSSLFWPTFAMKFQKVFSRTLSGMPRSSISSQRK